VAYLGYRHAERVTDKRNKHERQLAGEARVQQRLAEAYVELLELVHAVGQWSDLVRPIIGPGPEPPPLPSLPQQARVQALIDAYASDAVKGLMKSWQDVVTKVRVADMTIGFASQRDGVRSPAAAEQRQQLEEKGWQELMALRPAEHAARQALADQVAAELGPQI